MKRLILFMFSVVASIGSYAQLSAGINAGYTRNELYTNISNYDYNSYQREGGFNISVPVTYQLAPWCSLRADPGFIQKGFSLHQSLPGEHHTQLASRFNYLQLPVMAQFSFGGKRLRGYAKVGGYAAYWLSGRVKGTALDGFNYTHPVFHPYVQDVDRKYEFDSRRDRRLQAGWLVGGGLQYNITNKLDVFAEYTHYQDLTDQQKHYMRGQVPRYNITSAVTAGILYHFTTKKH